MSKIDGRGKPGAVNKRLWVRQNKDRIRNRNMKSKYGITLKEYDLMFHFQRGTCAHCKKDCPTGRALCIDHCHETEEVRGLLCINCNASLGHYEKIVNNKELHNVVTEYLGDNK